MFGLLIIFAIIIGFWFYSASTYGSGNELNYSNRTFLPAHCSISTAVDDDTQEKATVYFFAGKSRMDVYSKSKETTIVGHEVVAEGYVYTWREDVPEGQTVCLRCHTKAGRR